MRFLRVMAVAAGLVAVMSQAGMAQDNRQFKDAWFWGVKAGATSYSSLTTSSGGAPLVGGEWLITRTNGGLYLSFDQAFFKTTGGFVDRDPDSTNAFVRGVNLQNMRRFTIAGMVFPAQSVRVHPYIGGGLQLNQVAGAALVTAPTNSTRFAIAQDSIQSRKAVFTPVLIGGVQYRLERFSVFAQGGLTPIQQNFFLSNTTSSRAFNYSIELGARYNVGSSIDRAR